MKPDTVFTPFDDEQVSEEKKIGIKKVMTPLPASFTPYTPSCTTSSARHSWISMTGPSLCYSISLELMKSSQVSLESFDFFIVIRFISLNIHCLLIVFISFNYLNDNLFIWLFVWIFFTNFYELFDYYSFNFYSFLLTFYMISFISLILIDSLIGRWCFYIF